MSSTRYVKPLTLKPEPSRILGTLLLLGHGGALLLLFPLALPLMAKLFIAAVLLLSLRHNWRQQAGGAGKIHSLHWKSDGDWLLITAAGEQLDAELQVSSYAHPSLVVLNFHLPGPRRSHSVVLFPDALDRETFRQLRVRWGVMGDPLAGDEV
jgi:toxin CptA